MSRDLLYEIGRTILGPAFALYIEETQERIRAREIERVYFLAREGYLLEQLFRRLWPRSSKAPDCHYLHVSRRATSLPSVEAFGVRELRMVFSQPGAHSVRNVLRTFNICDSEFETLAHALVGDLDRPIFEPWNSGQLARLCDSAEFQARVRERALQARGLLVRYLDQAHFFDDPTVALLDVGWSGTIQDNLGRAAQSRSDIPDIHGYYLGYFNNTAPPARSYKEGILYDRNRPASITERAPLHFVQLFELAARSPEEMVIDYEEHAGRVKPLFANRKEPRGPIERLQRGILDYADTHLPSRAPFAARRDQVLRDLERLIFLPKLNEVRELRQLQQSEDWANTFMRPLVSPLEPGDFIRPKRWLDKFHHSCWKPGFLALTGGPPLCLAFRAYEERKLRR